MGVKDTLIHVVTERSRIVVALLLVATVVMGAGAGQVDQSSSLEQFQSESEAAEKLDYVEANFGSAGEDDTTAVQIIVRDGNVLDRETLVETLRLQRAIATDGRTAPTLANDSEATTASVATVVATAAIRGEQVRNLSRRAAELNRTRAELTTTVGRLTDLVNETRSLQREYDALNRSLATGNVTRAEYAAQADGIEADLAATRQEGQALLDGQRAAQFEQLRTQARSLQAELDALNASFARGEIDRATYGQRAQALGGQLRDVYRGVQGLFAEEFSDLRRRGEALAADQRALRNASAPSLAAQIEQLESMNESAVAATVETVLSAGGGSDGGDGGASGGGAFAFMPTSYEPGSTSADATMVLVVQRTESQTVEGMATDRLVASQTAMEELGRETVTTADTVVFGSGVISDEIDRSMADSLAIVGPLALLFVLLTLAVAYRDPLDILLGLLGIAVVLVWTFGFMGWAGIAFNQIFIAVPVLLIGLSIDYAIHIFMRHREERTEHGDGVRSAMKLGLASVGVALTWVTATTVIGFLSNLISPVPPIRDFGVVSSVGILSALVVFGALVPAAKVELDSFLEGLGLDRDKRAFGTGGGYLGSALSVGAVAARKAPWAVVALTLVVSAVGAYGGAQVDTSFAQEDFLAEDPPEWTKQLPLGMAPGNYSAKENLEYVNENFLREDSQAQLLLEGDVATADALQRMADAEDGAAGSDVVVVLSNGEPSIRSPLSVMEQVAARNETFNATLAAADTDGDGIPDRNVEAVYDALFAADAAAAGDVLVRSGGGYEAARLVVSVRGGAGTGAVTEEMRDVAGAIDGDGIEVTATGQPVVFEVIQQSLLETVIQSLIITLVAVFGFLMVVYRITEGSATLGAVTLLPVAFSVSWILGTMYLLGMPFNVLTGMITSLTVGLGVAYSIHLSERFNVELDRRDSTWEAMRTATTGTGGALLGSAATTVGGFGVLAFAILPALQQFGVITALTIIYAFLASVLVLPSLLVVWTRYVGPGVETAGDAAGRAEPAANGGAVESEQSSSRED